MQGETMATETIDHGTLSRLVEAGVVKGAHIVGQSGGWAVVVKYGLTERPLAAQRTRQVRLFRRFETLVSYLKDMGIARYEVDAAGFEVALIPHTVSNTAFAGTAIGAAVNLEIDLVARYVERLLGAHSEGTNA